MSAPLRISPEVADALARGGPVVCLETTLVAHGFPQGEGFAVGESSEAAVRAAGAVPATVGILDGVLVVGLSEAELRRFGDAGSAARKVGARDLAACCVQGALGATTVGGTLAAVRPLGIEVMATGGLGGVHREFPRSARHLVRPRRARPHARRDRLLRRQVAARRAGHVASCWRRSGSRCSAIARTRCRCSTRPPAARRSPRASSRSSEAAAVARAHWDLGSTGAVALARPPEPSLDDVEPLIEEALAEAARQGVRGPAITPFVLARLHERSDGRTLRANRELIVGNAALAGELAVALAAAA